MGLSGSVPAGRRAAAAAGLAVLVGAGATGLVKAAGSVDDSANAVAAPGCDDPTPITVHTTLDVAKPVQSAANAVQKRDKACVSYVVEGHSPADVADDIRQGKGPDVWIPDSKVRVDNFNETDAKVDLSAGPTIATSPVVMAVPKSLQPLKKAGADPGWATLLGSDVPVTTADPAQSTSSMLAVIAANQVVQPKAKTKLLSSYLRLSRATTTESALYFTADRDSKQARIFPTSEQQLTEYNRTNPAAGLAAVVPREGAGELAYTWVRPGRSTAPEKPVNALRDYLLSAKGRAALAKAGLRVPGASSPTGSALPSSVETIRYPTVDQSQGALRAWESLRKDARMLVLIDVSGSMMLPSGKDTRVGALIKMADGALNGLPGDTSLGAWVFSTDLAGRNKDYKPLVNATKPLNSPGYKDQLKKALRALPGLVKKNGDTGLYDATSDAYSYMTKTYDPDYVNSVVILTDGKNDDPGGGKNLQTLLDQLKKEYDPAKPVKVVSVAIGDGADPQALKRIAQPSSGLSYLAKTPGQITTAFVDAFLRRGE